MPFPACFQSPSDDDPFGADTESAMRLGVHLAARGLIGQAIERYALAYGGGPKSSPPAATLTLLDGAEIVDRVVPDLVLRGMLEAVQQAEAAEDEYGGPHLAHCRCHRAGKVVGDLDTLLTPFWDANRHLSDSCSVNPLATSTTDWCTALRKMVPAFPTPAMVVRMLVEAFVAQGAATTQHTAAFPEAACPTESLLLATLARPVPPPWCCC